MFLQIRFSSGDLSSECDDADDPTLPPAARPPPTTNQPMPGGPPNIPPPPGKRLALWSNIFIRKVREYFLSHKKQHQALRPAPILH